MLCGHAAVTDNPPCRVRPQAHTSLSVRLPAIACERLASYALRRLLPARHSILLARLSSPNPKITT